MATTTLMDIVQAMATKLGTLFYIVPVHDYYESKSDLPNYIEDAVPYFFLLIFIEWCYGKLRKRNFYSGRDFMMSTSLGIVQQALGLFVTALGFVPYSFVHEKCADYRRELYAQLPLSAATTVDPYWQDWLLFCAGMFGCDFAYYVFHRYAHTVHLWWAAHSVHHSGERYNLATALRQGGTQNFTSWLFYIPLAALGLPLTTYMMHNSVNTLYQFWIHTEAIGRLPWFVELFMNTPSHHRVHHRPPGNCNYAGVFIIWDRLFGTFISEGSIPVPSTSSAPTNAATDTAATPTTPATSIIKEEDKAEAVGGGETVNLSKPHKEVDNNSHIDDDDDDNDNHSTAEWPRGVIYGLARPVNTFDPVKANFVHFERISDPSPKDGVTLEKWSFAQRIRKLLRVVFTTRIVHRWRIVSSAQEFMPDILQQWRCSGQSSGRNFLSSVWVMLFQLPPSAVTYATQHRYMYTPEGGEKEDRSGRSEKEVKKDDALWTVDSTVGTAYPHPLLERDESFIKGLLQREGLPPRSLFRSLGAGMQFMLTLLCFYSLALHANDMRNSYLGSQKLANVAILIVLSAQMVKYYYDA